MPRKWKHGWTPTGVDENEIKTKARDTLAKVSFGREWVNGKGVKHTELLLNGQVVGEIHGNINLAGVDIGDFKVTGRGVKVFLLRNGVPVGHIWINQ